MKITIVDPVLGEEEEIIFKCHTLTDDMNRLISKLKHGDIKIAGYDTNGISLLAAADI